MSEILTSTDVSSAREQFSTLLNRAAFGKERILLTRHGKPVVALTRISHKLALETSKALFYYSLTDFS
jgi:prevent-host-death family protein